MGLSAWHGLPDDGPGGGARPASVRHVRAADGIGLRLAHWRAAATGRGAVLLMQGRSEYLEKYGRVAGDLCAAGFDVLALDWRGQGGSDRLLDSPGIGHVADFADYQRDVAALIAAAQECALPRPWHLLAHSMGGAIGLRAMLRGLPVASAAFSPPMWGIRVGGLPPPAATTVGLGLGGGAGRLGRGGRALPGRSTVLDVAFNANRLTGDLATYTRLMHEAAAWPQLMIAAPSFDWLRAAMAECRALARQPSPGVPALIAVAGAERIVQPAAIRRRAAAWPGATLLELPGSRHEPMFETPPIRAQFMGAVIDHFSRHH